MSDDDHGELPSSKVLLSGANHWLMKIHSALLYIAAVLTMLLLLTYCRGR